MPKESSSSKGGKPKKGKNKEDKEEENSWKYCDQLLTLMEADKLGKMDITKLCCRELYCVKLVRYLSENDRDNEIHTLYRSLVGQDDKFMRRWL